MIKNTMGFAVKGQKLSTISIRAPISALRLSALNTLIHYLLFILLILWPSQTFADEPLDTYRKWLGSPLEREIIQYARACITHELDHDTLVPDLQVDLPLAGLYLSLAKGKHVRACIGTFGHGVSDMRKALTKLTEEIVYADLRSRPLSLNEMKDLSIVLSFVGPLRDIANPYGIDFTREGLYVSQGERVGVLLPGESKTLDYGLRKIKRQIHMDPNQPVRYASFQVVVFDERRL